MGMSHNSGITSTVLSRRRFSLLLGLSALAAAAAGTRPAWASDALSERLSAIEAGLDGRLGVAILDSESGGRWQHRGDERFPLCSTFKTLACAGVLARVDAGSEDLQRRIPIRAEDIVTYSPATETRVGGEMTLAELCEAAITLSDNTAGNLILERLEGPAGLTAFLREQGDGITRLDRWETALNEARPGDPRDTTTPNAMAETLRRLILEDVLSEGARRQLAAWLIANKTGDARLRAGLPKDWLVGDKTGSGDYGTTNDVAVIWPPGRAPLIVAVYLTETDAPFEERNAAIAEVGRALAALAA